MKYLLLFLPFTLLAQISGTFRVTGPVAPTATNSNYGASLPVYNYGGLLTGLSSASDLANTNIYPLARRHAGQLAILTNGVIYQLTGGLTNWTIYSAISSTNGTAVGLSVSNLTTTGTANLASADVTTAVITNAYIGAASVSNLITLDSLSATNIIASGNITISTAGKGLVIKDNTNGRIGIATLDGASPGKVTVANNTVTTNTIILLTRFGSQTDHPVTVTSVTNGASFTITSPHNGDTDKVFYLLVEKIP